MSARTIVSRFDGWCLTCRQPIAAGTRVVWISGKGVMHIECAPTVPFTKPVLSDRRIAELATERVKRRNAFILTGGAR